MPPDLWSLYELMLRSRLFEEAIAQLWHDGLISGEMHMGTGEEAIIAGVVDHLVDGDALALDHRGSAAMLMRGVDPILILRELLGFPDGLCAGDGGHMHLFSKDHLAAASGIVGATGPAAAGFGLAAQQLRPGTVAVAFFGEGTMNQGMLMEALNLAKTWNLPVVFICKDDDWSISTKSTQATGTGIAERAGGFGIHTEQVDGRYVSQVWEAANHAIERARSNHGPTFLHAYCAHLEGHFLGLKLIRIVRDPVREMPEVAIPLTKSLLDIHGASIRERLTGLKIVLGGFMAVMRDQRQMPKNDPLPLARANLISEPARLEKLEDQVMQEVRDAIQAALSEVVA
ncbi:MAG: thiamine pyrophosphate-dependent dehydrogenase E1 component subunit alpha [Anaerolineales bacterium]|nr:thiamine pyrophosphate-dependent dehydrogenase E1 component subunit alpha [Anaerolineales bacterium]